MGIDTRMSSYKTYYSGTTDRITNLQLGVRELDGTLVAPGGYVLAQRGDRRADRGARVPARAGDHRQRVRGGGRRRHLAGRDDGLQRRVGSRVADLRAAPALALHQPLRAGTRRDRVLAVARPEVRERHRRVGAGEGVRGGRRDQHRDLRWRVAARRELGDTPRRDRARHRRARRGSDAPEGQACRSRRKARRRRARPRHAQVYSADGELIRSETWTTSYEGEERVVRVGTKVEPKKTKPVPKTPAGDASPPVEPRATPTTPRP